MSEYDLSCVVIQQNTIQQQMLLQSVRANHAGIQVGLANGSAALRSLLSRSPMLLFYTVPDKLAVAVRYERRLLLLSQHLAPDCILVRMTEHTWRGLADVKPVSGSVAQSGEICTIATVNKKLLKQQLDYLVNYAQLKVKFRQCKHLLSIAELRSQWLVDYAREAVAYVAADQHLHANIAYLTLFGFNAVSDAQAMRVFQLVQPEDQAVFAAIKQAAEQHTKPSNKLLLTLQTVHGRPFRAEIRCIPAVYRGRRCVQLYVHPLLSGEQQAVEIQTEAAEKKSASPWEEQSESARQLQQHTQDQERVQQANKQANTTELISTDLLTDLPAVLDSGAIKQLQPAFKELLNLRGKDHPALLWAQPWLQYGKPSSHLTSNTSSNTSSNPSRLNYSQLLANAHDQATRFQLDYWNLRAALGFLAQQKDSPVLQQVVVSLGSWALSNVRQVAQLLKLLKKRPALNQQLVLGLDSTVCLQRQKAAGALLPLYKATGAQLMLEYVYEVDAKLLALLELSGSRLIQLHDSHGNTINTADGIPEALRELLAQVSGRNVATVVSGVQDLNTLNLLCETTATYLQGPILDRFSR